MEIERRRPGLRVADREPRRRSQLALLVAACGGSGDTESGDEESSSEGETTTLKVGVIPIADVRRSTSASTRASSPTRDSRSSPSSPRAAR